MSNDVKIFVDTAADLPSELMEKYNIGLIPMLSVIGDKSYVIGKEMTTEEFYEKYLNGDILPKTSQTPYGDMYDILLDASNNYKTVIYFTLSSKASGQNHTANLVKEDILENANPNADIRIVDTMSFSMLIGDGVIRAAEQLESGMGIDEVIENAKEYISKWHALFVVNDLMFLEKGGRLRKSTAVIGNLLDIKPVLTVADGLIEQEKNLRGKKKVCKKLCDLIREDDNFDEDAKNFLILHSDEKLAEEANDAITDEFGEDTKIFTRLIGPLIATYVGDRIVAIIYRTK